MQRYLTDLWSQTATFHFIYYFIGAVFLFISLLLLRRSFGMRRVATLFLLLAAISLLLEFTISPLPIEWVHLVMYGSLAGILVLSLGNRGKLSELALGWAGATLIWGIDEIIQYFWPDRVGDLRDFYFNSVSALGGVAILALFLHSVDITRSKKVELRPIPTASKKVDG